MSLFVHANPLCISKSLHVCPTTTCIAVMFSSAILWKPFRFVGGWVGGGGGGGGVYEQVDVNMLTVMLHHRH